jgi:hypothetical protein
MIITFLPEIGTIDRIQAGSSQDWPPATGIPALGKGELQSVADAKPYAMHSRKV